MPLDSKRNYDEKAHATSTPNMISGRSSIHNEKTISPIPRNDCGMKNRLQCRKKSVRYIENSDSSEISDEGSSESEDVSTLSANSYTPNSSRNCEVHLIGSTVKDSMNESADKKLYIAIAGVLIFLAVAIAFKASADKSNERSVEFTTAKMLQDRYPSQPQYTWDAIFSGISEVKQFNKPSVFLLLYERQTRKTIDSFVHDVSRYASGVLNDDIKTPIELNSAVLNTVKARTDYGYIINAYKPELKDRAVMVIKNLDRIPGVVAQAFHSMCDEYSPLVDKSLFIFTIEVKNVSNQYKSEYEHVEDVLKHCWDDLDDDIFYPLFTRISSMVLKIEPEER